MPILKFCFPLCAMLLAGEASADWSRQAALALVDRGDAHSLATAALLDAGAGPEWAARASALAPDDAAIAWIRLRACAARPGCDVREAATALRWIDADNAAAWLPTLSAAVKDKDRVEIDRVLTDMAQGRHFDLYWNPIVVMMVDTLKHAAKRLPAGAPNGDAARLAAVVGIAAARLIPPFQPVGEACREAAAGTDRHEACLKVARLLQQGDTVVGEIFGCGLEKRQLPVDSKEARALAEHRRVLEWRMASTGKFDLPLLPWLRNAHARWRIARMRSLPREQDVVLAVLREQALPLYPPENRR